MNENRTPVAGEAYDPHRFEVERSRPKSNVFPKIVLAFMMTLGVIGGTAYFIKTKVSEFMRARSEPSTVEKQLRVDEKAPETRKFEDVVRTALTPQVASAPPIPVVGAASGARGGAAPKPEPPNMMLGGSTVSEQAASEPPRMRTIEAYGEQVADGIKAPTTTPQVSARQFGDRSYLLARGSFIPCVLETQLVSTVAGSSNCVVPEHVYSENGKVLLIEKGSKIMGEYKSDVKQGDARIAILWQRIKTPTGVVIDVDSPATDAVGSMGAQGGIDYHWAQRIGAAVLLSIIGDVIDIKKEQSTRGTTVVTAENTRSTTKSLAERVLESTINIPPTISKNRGDRVMVYLNRDLWFNTVYTHTMAP